MVVVSSVVLSALILSPPTICDVVVVVVVVNVFTVCGGGSTSISIDCSFISIVAVAVVVVVVSGTSDKCRSVSPRAAPTSVTQKKERAKGKAKLE